MCCGRTSIKTGRKVKRKLYKCNKCNTDISSEYLKQETTAKLLLKGHSSVRIHVVCTQCKATSIITTNL